jgi:hypothetical protein
MALTRVDGNLIASGVSLTFNAGNAAFPTLTTSGDTNTGIFFPAADNVAISVGGTEGTRLTSTGLGIGTSSPARKLDVVGAIRSAGVSNPYVEINNGTSSGYLELRGGSNDLNIEISGANSLVFRTNNAERLRIPSDAAGITFPATQSASSNANTLDDYEEGTWTPSLGGDTTYAQQTGQYTKVGNLVFIKGVLVITSIGTGSTTVISGLPFTNTSGIAGVSVASFFQSATSVVSFFAQVTSGGAAINAYSLTAAGTTEAINPIFQNNTQFQFSACYRV